MLIVVLTFGIFDTFYEMLTYGTTIVLFTDIGVTLVIFAVVFIIG